MGSWKKEKHDLENREEGENQAKEKQARSEK